LKLSVTVLRPGDSPVQHNEQDVDDTDGQDEDLANMVLLRPKGLDAVENILQVRIFKAENLPKMDTIGTCDPFVEVKYGRDVGRTAILKGTQSPVWNEEIRIPVTLPSMADVLTVKLYDFDAGSVNELISQSYFSFKDEIANNGGKSIRWHNFYNGQGQGRETTDYCGRVLFGFSSSPGGADGKVANVPVAVEPAPEVTSYTLQLDVFEVQGIDAPLYPIYVVASIGPYSTKTPHASTKKKTAEFYQSAPDLEVSYPSDIKQVPDLFLYVYEETPINHKRHGYIRYSLSTLDGQGIPKWEVLKKKSSGAKDDEHPPGFINFRVNFGTTASIKTKPRPKMVAVKKKQFQVRAHIYAGRDLPAGDEDALSDPYCLVSISYQKARTKTINHTVYPSWFETAIMDIDLPDLKELTPDIHVSVYDYDTLTPDEYLGRVVVPTEDISYNKELPVAKWYPLYLHDGKKGKGEIMASFQILPAEIAKSEKIPDIKPKYIDTQVNIGVIGLRDLAPFQLLPVTNSYVKFTVTGAKQSVSTKKSSIPTASSPNFFENIVIPVGLPQNVDFVPALLIEVFDTRALGKDAKVASASVPLSGFVPWAPKSKELPFGVRLPPAVEESAFHQPPPPTPTLPSISSIPSLSSASAQLNIGGAASVTIDIPEVVDESASLLGKGKAPLLGGLKGGNKPQVIETELVSKRELPATTVPGMEEEPDEPQRVEYESEVEHQMKSFPFLEVELFRGTSEGISTGNLFNKREAIVGRFKGSISVKYTDDTQRSSSSSKRDEPAIIDVTKLNTPRPYVLRVYIEERQNLVPHDTNGSSDPYLVVSSSNAKSKQKSNTIKDIENVKPHTLQPQFYKMYELKGVLPDDSELKVQVWDKDEVGADDFIGETRYDLEMLWFSEEWRKMPMKPKENRALWNPLSSFPQGKLKMWVELLTLAEAGHTPPSFIGPPVKIPYELRIVVWETKNVVPKDKILGKDSSDQFVVTRLLSHPKSEQKTDVHDSVMDGCGKFNWRIVYPDVFLPYDAPRLKLQVYDKDRIGPNDAIAEANVNLKGFFQKALKNKTARIGALANLSSMTNDATGLVTKNLGALGTSSANTNTAGPYNSGQWLDLFHPSFDGPQGSICLELEVLLREDAAVKRAGDGRNEPNQNPFLPAPVRPSRNWLGDMFKFLGLDKIKKYR